MNVLGAYASDPRRSRGRLFPESPSPTRSEFERDRDRVIHSTGFRRLKDKTQVFLYDEGDHYRTRLTHTLEVTQIARAIARGLALEEDLTEALALAHDLGHPPFGHAGERALDRAMSGFGGFDHNAQSLRVVTHLERRYPRFDGLNLTWEALEGLVKHNGPLLSASGHPLGRYGATGLPFAIAEYAQGHDLWLATHAGPEAQAAAIADDIAYDAHDLDDGVRAGLVDLDRLSEVPLVSEIGGAIRREFTGLAVERVRAELVRRLISAMILDVVAESRRRLEDLGAESPDAVRHARQPSIGFSSAMAAAEAAVKAMLYRDVYRHPRVADVMHRAEGVVERLFTAYGADSSAMPDAWRPPPSASDVTRARAIADFIAGMTDRYAIAEARRLYPGDPGVG